MDEFNPMPLIIFILLCGLVFVCGRCSGVAAGKKQLIPKQLFEELPVAGCYETDITAKYTFCGGEMESAEPQSFSPIIKQEQAP